MYNKGHHGISAFVYTPIAIVLVYFNQYHLAATGLAIMWLTSSLPDIDINTFIGRFLTHRGITHTVWFGLFMGLVFASGSLFVEKYIIPKVLAENLLSIGYFSTVLAESPLFSKNSSLFSVGLLFHLYVFVMGFIGICSHLLGDIITPSGLRPFAPIKETKYTFNLTKAANKTSNSLIFIFGYITLIMGVTIVSYLKYNSI